MSKYIDADHLKAEIERLKDEYTDIAIDSQRGWVNANFVIDDLEQLQSQIDSLPEEKPSEDLEEAAENIYKTPFGTRAEDFIAGAKWQKMKKATVEAEAEVCKLTDRVWITPTNKKRFHQDVYDNFKAGDKVKIIIVKEDDGQLHQTTKE